MFSLQRHVLLLAASGIIIAIILFGVYTSSWSRPHDILLDFFSSRGQTSRQLHFLVPATASTLNFCRFLLSSIITTYPEPILLGWDGHGRWDGAKSHLFKISETLAYLNSLPPSNDEDLALLIDAYDIWLVLRPEVMISRYFELLEQSNARLRSQGLYGRSHGGAEVRNTLFWGPDKVCWPPENRRAACWAVPDSPLRKKAFGPDTDAWMVLNRPRWLNSGTLMGPVKDMRDMFNRTLEIVDQTFDGTYPYHNSDQFYFQNLWAEQEIERTRLQYGEVHPPFVGYDTSGNKVHGWVPEIRPGQRTEFHVALDYNATLFQTAAGYTEYLTWMRFNNTSKKTLDGPHHHKRLDEIELPKDIENSQPPFVTKSGTHASKIAGANTTSWKDMVLGVNVVTQTVFPLFHVTGDKGVRDRWWPRMWFHPHGRKLLAGNSISLHGKDAALIAEVNGIRWTGANASLVGPSEYISWGGAWTDQGGYLNWKSMCKDYEKDLFLDSKT